ncbi:hypothetical protein [Streptomyces sp. JW3]|uniref:hypothetical protein n=1 Tax=Streptomyces sp. JW3 TaxID=3456955 RepID=UPI003FA482EF
MIFSKASCPSRQEKCTGAPDLGRAPGQVVEPRGRKLFPVPVGPARRSSAGHPRTTSHQRLGGGADDPPVEATARHLAAVGGGTGSGGTHPACPWPVTGHAVGTGMPGRGAPPAQPPDRCTREPSRHTHVRKAGDLAVRGDTGVPHRTPPPGEHSGRLPHRAITTGEEAGA